MAAAVALRPAVGDRKLPVSPDLVANVLSLKREVLSQKQAEVRRPLKPMLGMSVVAKRWYYSAVTSFWPRQTFLIDLHWERDVCKSAYICILAKLTTKHEHLCIPYLIH